MTRRVRPRNELTENEKEERRIARKLKFSDEEPFRRWRNRMRNLPPSDPRYLRPEVDDLDLAQLKRIRELDRKHLDPVKRLIKKKDVLTSGKARITMSPFAFADKYEEMLNALLRDPNITPYRKRLVRKTLRELHHDMDVSEKQQAEIYARELP
jgi:hypothetical protein